MRSEIPVNCSVAELCPSAGAVRRVQQQAGGNGYAERAVRGVASAGVVGRRALLGLGGDRTVFWTLAYRQLANTSSGQTTARNVHK
jgi:hypothetical protein